MASRVLVMMTGIVITATVQAAHAHEQHEGADAEQTVHDAGYAGKTGHCHIDHPGEGVVRRILGEIYPGENAQGGDDNQGHKHKVECAYQGQPDPAFTSTAGRVAEEVFPGQHRGGFSEYMDDNNEHRNNHQQGNTERRPLGDGLGTLLPVLQRSYCKGILWC